ncbi:MAG: hypothetical protein ACTHXA_08965 [Gulosibacter sp.]|uniref:hypothetical protein n=1 Tax=Gulosibacter sp. TaxID=2817531 RepID=UPI003F91EA4B
MPNVDTMEGTGRVTVSHPGIPLLVEGKPVLELEIAYWLVSRSSIDPRLTVESSSLKLRVVDVQMPLFSLDFRRNEKKNIPASHYNVHAKRDDMVWAMASAGRRHRGRRRRQALDSGKRNPQFSDLHFPTGGARYRPSLEDVLQFAILEFGIDTRPEADDVLIERRRVWREIQLRAAIGDDLETAISELEAQGFAVERTRTVPSPRRERTDRY